MRLAKDTQPIIRGEALELLGETQDKKYADLFIAGLNDQSYGVIDQSALAVARVKDPRTYYALVRLTNTASWKGRIQTAGLDGLAELGDKRAFDVGYKVATDKALPSNVRTAALKVVVAVGEGDPRAYPLIFEQFKLAYDASKVQGIADGMQAVIKIADPRGQEVFDLLKTKYKDQPGSLQTVLRNETEFKASIKP